MSKHDNSHSGINYSNSNQDIIYEEEGIELTSSQKSSEKKEPTLTDTVKRWSVILNTGLMAAFFLALKPLEGNIFAYRAVMLSMLATEASGWISKLLIALNAPKHERAEAWLEVAKSSLFLGGVSVVVIGAAMLETVVIAALAPTIFTALCITATLYHFGGMFYFGYEYFNSPRGKEGSIERELSDARWEKFKAHAKGLIVSAAATVGIALGLLTFPISFPLALTVAGSIVAANVIWETGALQWMAKKTGLDKPIKKFYQWTGLETAVNTFKKWTGFEMFKKHSVSEEETHLLQPDSDNPLMAAILNGHSIINPMQQSPRGTAPLREMHVTSLGSPHLPNSQQHVDMDLTQSRSHSNSQSSEGSTALSQRDTEQWTMKDVATPERPSKASAEATARQALVTIARRQSEADLRKKAVETPKNSSLHSSFSASK